MVCNTEIHSDLILLNESLCPYCDEVLDCDKVLELCCLDPFIENLNGMNTCINCGIVHGYVFVPEYINFHENKHKFHRKSIYHRKYHIENVLNDICYGNNVVLSHNERDRIFKAFTEIGTVIPSVNGKRKRMISTKFIIKELFILLGIPSEFIKVTKSKRTLKFYNRYWAEILLLKCDRIMHIIGK